LVVRGFLGSGDTGASLIADSSYLVGYARSV
jgi:hypothetical protein